MGALGSKPKAPVGISFEEAIASWRLRPVEPVTSQRIDALLQAFEARALFNDEHVYRQNAPISEVQSVVGFIKSGLPAVVLERANSYAITDGIKRCLHAHFPLLGSDALREQWIQWARARGASATPPAPPPCRAARRGSARSHQRISLVAHNQPLALLSLSPLFATLASFPLPVFISPSHRAAGRLGG